jgi:hypothetical protein
LRLKITPFVRNLPFGDSFESAFADRGTQAERSTTFFAVMKSQASPLIPDLAPLIYDTTAWDRSSRAMYALAIIGTNSWPVFQQALTTTNFAMTRRAVINVIAFAHQHRFADWSTALPSILKCANGTDKTVTMEAIRAVRHMRLSPESCIPLLTDKLHSADPNIRAAAIEALEQFGHLAESALPPIEVALNDTDAYVRNSATNALETIRNQIRTNSVPK